MHVYRCAVKMPEGGSIWELYHGCYLGYKPNRDINVACAPRRRGHMYVTWYVPHRIRTEAKNSNTLCISHGTKAAKVKNRGVTYNLLFSLYFGVYKPLMYTHTNVCMCKEQINIIL